jgi:hypothetical protein
MGLDVDLDPGAFVDERTTLAEGLRSFFTQGEFCDVVLRAAGGEAFSAHAVVMGTLSNTFRDRLREAAAKATAAVTAEAASEASLRVENASEKGAVEATTLAASSPSVAQPESATTTPVNTEAAASTTEAVTANVAASDQTVATPVAEGAPVAVTATCGRPELLLNGIGPEAVKSMLDFAYGSSEAYAPTSDEVNQHVLKLAAEFDIAGLRECASVWLTRELDSSNVVQRLATCTEFQLKQIYEAIIEELVACPLAVASISNDMKIMQQPRLLQDLLVRMVRCHAERQKSTTPAPAAATEVVASDKSATDAAGTNGASANVAKTKATGLKTLKSSRANSTDLSENPTKVQVSTAAGAGAAQKKSQRLEDLDPPQGKRPRVAGA